MTTPTPVVSQLDEEVRKLVLARLSVLSPDTYLSIGSDGSFSRDDLMEHVREGDEIGKKIEAIEIEWVRSWKEKSVAV